MADEAKLPIMGHLAELRRRLFQSAVAIALLFTVTFTYSEYIFRALVLPMSSDVEFSTSAPFLKFVPREGGISKLVFLAPAEAFWAHMKIALIAAVILCVPVLLFHVWRFISPGLKDEERRYVLPFIVIGTGLFVAGAAFCFFLVLPFAMKFLLTYKTENMTAMITVEKYVDFTLKFVLAFGIVFELPIVLVFLTRMGIVSTDTLAKNRKYAVLAAFVVAAFLTPTPDAFNQTLMAVPMIVLYEGGIWASRLIAAASRKKAPAQ